MSKPLKLFAVRVDEDVEKALKAFKATGTINEGLRRVLLGVASYSRDNSVPLSSVGPLPKLVFPPAVVCSQPLALKPEFGKPPDATGVSDGKGTASLETWRAGRKPNT